MEDNKGARYDVALSFAGEDRDYVEKVAEGLKDAGVRVFYDNYEQVSLWGKNLYDHLDWVYREASAYCVVFVSRHYAEKVWTNHERQSAQAKAFQENEEYVLPARFDQTSIPGLRPTIGYLDLTKFTPAELAGMIRQKLGNKPHAPGFPRNPVHLYEALELKGQGEAKEAEREEAWNVALGFWEALSRMTPEERKVVGGAMAFGCPGELPNGVHVSLDYLSRMVRMPPAQVMESLSAVRSLNVKVIARDPEAVHPMEDGELRKEDKDLLVSFWSPRAGGAEDPTGVVFHTVREACDHYCADHGLEVITSLDFHGLATGRALAGIENDAAAGE